MSLSGFLDGTVVRVEVAGLPPFDVTLGGEASPLVKAIRPKVTILNQGTEIYTAAPYGEPSQGFPTVAVVLGCFLVALLFLVFRR